MHATRCVSEFYEPVIGRSGGDLRIFLRDCALQGQGDDVLIHGDAFDDVAAAAMTDAHRLAATGVVERGSDIGDGDASMIGAQQHLFATANEQRRGEIGGADHAADEKIATCDSVDDFGGIGEIGLGPGDIAAFPGQRGGDDAVTTAYGLTHDDHRRMHRDQHREPARMWVVRADEMNVDASLPAFIALQLHRPGMRAVAGIGRIAEQLDGDLGIVRPLPELLGAMQDISGDIGAGRGSDEKEDRQPAGW